jgi:hypothetical protein
MCRLEWPPDAESHQYTATCLLGRNRDKCHLQTSDFQAIYNAMTGEGRLLCVSETHYRNIMRDRASKKALASG